MANVSDIDMGSIGRTVIVDPSTGTPIVQGGATIAAGTVAAATAMAGVLGAQSGKLNYISGFQVTGAGATAAAVALITVTGLASGTLPYYIAVPASNAPITAPLNVKFEPPLPASAPSLNIQVNVPSLGAGNPNAAVSVQGFRV